MFCIFLNFAYVILYIIFRKLIFSQMPLEFTYFDVSHASSFPLPPAIYCHKWTHQDWFICALQIDNSAEFFTVTSNLSVNSLVNAPMRLRDSLHVGVGHSWVKGYVHLPLFKVLPSCSPKAYPYAHSHQQCVTVATTSHLGVSRKNCVPGHLHISASSHAQMFCPPDCLLPQSKLCPTQFCMRNWGLSMDFPQSLYSFVILGKPLSFIAETLHPFFSPVCTPWFSFPSHSQMRQTQTFKMSVERNERHSCFLKEPPGECTHRLQVLKDGSIESMAAWVSGRAFS